MVYDPATGKTRVYQIPVPHQGIISVTPDESRGVAYISTCSDERPIESTHFMILDLETGKYRDLVDARHMYAFIVVDQLGPGLSSDARRRHRPLRPAHGQARDAQADDRRPAADARNRTWPTRTAIRSTGTSRPTAKRCTPSR